jgi:hypothetical protein
MIKNYTILNILISIFFFIFIFYSYAGVSGGDIAIIMGNFIFGCIQFFSNTIYFYIKKSRTENRVLWAIFLCQIIETTIFIVWGYQINEYIKHNLF